MEIVKKVKNYFVDKFTSHNSRVTVLSTEFADFFMCEKIFVWLGISFLNSSVQRWRKIHFILSQLFGALLIVQCVISFIMNHGDLLVMTENCGIIAIQLTIFVKWISLDNLHRVKIVEILGQLQVFFSRFKSNQPELTVRHHLNEIKKFIYITAFFFLTLVALFNFIPIIEQLYAKFTGSSFDLQPILNVYWPFSLRHGSFELVFCLILWYFVMCIPIVLATDYLFVTFSQMIYMGLNDLGDTLVKIDFEDEEKALDELKKFIQIHVSR